MSNEQLTNEQIHLIQEQLIETMNEIDPSKGRLIQIKQGPRSELTDDSLLIGEPCYLTDDKVFVIGTGNGYIEFPNIESLSESGVTDGSITYENLNQALKDRILELENSKVTINNTLTSDSIEEALSANQGKILNDKIQNLQDNTVTVNVVDNLTSTSTNDPLSANQGRVLNDRIDEVIANNDITVVNNTLTSTSTTEALSANQGKILNDTKASKDVVTTTTNGLMSKEDKVKLNGVETGANKTVLVDNLTSTSTVQGLSANQGKILNDKIDNVIANNDITIVTDNLTSDSATEALSARQGKVLDDKIQNHIDNDVVLNVIDNLDSTSSVDVLSANQGRILNNNKADKTLATTSINGLMSSSDKSKLNGIDTGANKTVVTDNLTTTSTTNALSANQGKVLNDKIQDLIDNPVSTTINNTLTSTSTTEALSANQGRILNDKIESIEVGGNGGKNLEFTTTLSPFNWNLENAPYTYTVSIPEILATDNPIVIPIFSNTLSTALTERDEFYKIDDAKTTDGNITFRCFSEVPSAFLNVIIKVARV